MVTEKDGGVVPEYPGLGWQEMGGKFYMDMTSYVSGHEMYCFG